MNRMPSAGPSFRTPLHDWHARHGARFIDSDGWLIPQDYTRPGQEPVPSQDGLTLTDVSHFAKFCILGKGVPAIAGTLGLHPPRTVCILDLGAKSFVCLPCPERLGVFCFTTNARQAEEDLKRLCGQAPVILENQTCALAGFCLEGNGSDKLLRQLTSFDVSSALFASGSCAETSLAGIHTLLIRSDEQATSKFYLYVAWDLAEFVWETLMESGKEWGVRPTTPKG